MSKESREYIATGGVFVEALEHGGRIKSFDQLIETLEDARDVKYAKAYKKWVDGGRKGNPPAGQPNKKGSKRHKAWMYIRSVVHTLTAE
jgi:hypothetical protein